MESDDVFDSVTWETPTVTNGYDAGFVDATQETGLGGGAAVSRGGPGFRHLQDDEGSAPHEPKWEGYSVAIVKDPIKELEGTKDVYVSYLVQAKVGSFLSIPSFIACCYEILRYIHSITLIWCFFGSRKA